MNSHGSISPRDESRFPAEIQRLRSERRKLAAEVRGLQGENLALRNDKAALTAQVAELQALVAELRAKLAEAERRGKRQAAPFSKGEPRANPKKRGRKPGANYGRKGRRPPPPPGRIDEVLEAPLPSQCPHCGGAIAEGESAPQFQMEIPRRPIVRQFNVHKGICNHCGRHLQGTHPLQTSDALGAAASQVGPDAQAAVAFLNKYCGLSYGKISKVFATLFGIQLTPGGAAQIVLRAGRRCEPAYRRIQAAVRRSPWVVLDETGWKVGGRGAWLHVQVGKQATCFTIARGRGADVAADVLGWDYAGTMIHDGWSPYNSGFGRARHQQCVQHVLRRARQILKSAVGGAVRFPRRVIAILEAALRERNEHEAGRRTANELAESALTLACQLEEITQRRKRNVENNRLAKHLRKHLWHWFWFLLEPGLDATNWRSEQGLRLGVINRKVWGGNRDDTGRKAQEILMSVNATCDRHHICPVTYLSETLRSRRPPPLPP